MIVRKLDKDGDMVFGRSLHDYLIDDPNGVAQCAMTRLELWRGQWFLDKGEGTPWLQEILGKKDAVDLVIRDRILKTPGCTGIAEFSAILDPDARRLTVTATIETEFGEAELKAEL